MFTINTIQPCIHCGNPFARVNPAQLHCSLTCRFWSKVDVGDVDACWPWTSAIQPESGYGLLLYERTAHLAHRIAWLLTYARWPNPNALHHCDNPPCVNPAHLFEGTYKDNAVDREAKGRGGGWRMRGELHHRSVLKEIDIPVIRQLLASGVGLRKIGEQFGVTHGAIGAVKEGRSWTYV